MSHEAHEKSQPPAMKYLQRVGHVSCVRCDFETSDDMTYEQQDAAMMAHLAEKHPDWMTDGGASVLQERLATPYMKRKSKFDAEIIGELEVELASLKQQLERAERKIWNEAIEAAASRAWEEVARQLRREVHPVGSKSVEEACAAYDALAGNNG